MYALIFANAMLFLSTLSLRRATFGLGTPSILPQFLSTLSLRRATLPSSCNVNTIFISIHALLAESDLSMSAPRVPIITFLSTLSLRRATHFGFLWPSRVRHFYPRSPCGERPGRIWSTAFAWYFYPRSPCGERPWQRGSRITYVEISIHALLAESDARRVLGFVAPDISIHALLAESDRARYMCPLCVKNFYPRSPCGERLLSLRLPTWAATISIHALLAESDVNEIPYQRKINHFYPRSPCGERHAGCNLLLAVFHFYPRSPCGERPENPCTAFWSAYISIHALLAESDGRPYTH